MIAAIAALGVRIAAPAISLSNRTVALTLQCAAFTIISGELWKLG